MAKVADTADAVNAAKAVKGLAARRTSPKRCQAPAYSIGGRRRRLDCATLLPLNPQPSTPTAISRQPSRVGYIRAQRHGNLTLVCDAQMPDPMTSPQAPVLPDTLPTASEDHAATLLAQLRDIAPHAFTENRIDFDKLKAALGGAVSEANDRKERYGLTWAGKADAFRNVQTLSTGTLAPMASESVNWDATENLIIEGDNLEVLKLLQRPYHGKVKMIYIDPPYNTGNEFIYPDNFRENYLRPDRLLATSDLANHRVEDFDCFPRDSAVLIACSYAPAGGRFFGELKAICTC